MSGAPLGENPPEMGIVQRHAAIAALPTMPTFAAPSLTARFQRVAWGSLIGGIVLAVGLANRAIAQTPAPPTGMPAEEAMLQLLIDIPSSYGNDLGFFEEADENWPIVSQDSVSLFQATLPSVWWSRDSLPTLWRVSNDTIIRVAGYRLVRGWTAFYSQTAAAPVIDVQVDPQYWNRFNDFQQFAVLRQLGTAGMNYGHHVRIYNSIDLAGIHACDFSNIPGINDRPSQEVPTAQLLDVNCEAAIGSFVNYEIPNFGDDLFAPP
ncbi:hypothetical protein [Leptolyngbya iicbica]|uniref:Uncharacterized protein n=2 Tax=Cyanophyceae TaxID=3028117 RepID=A0A4Q7EGX2_9CYAN|nr:hypothetical protein [Leptolyngbya sp. LK]RZM82326.1 hypothetical protein DYY88_03500 [Leptolyngbya sp. LK]